MISIVIGHAQPAKAIRRERGKPGQIVRAVTVSRRACPREDIVEQRPVEHRRGDQVIVLERLGRRNERAVVLAGPGLAMIDD